MKRVGNIVRAAYRLARFKGIDTGLEPHWVDYLFHFILPPDIRPSFVVDISDVFDRWLEMAKCYDSQLGYIDNYYNRVIGFKKMHLHHHRTAEYLEAFYCDKPNDAGDFDLFRV